MRKVLPYFICTLCKKGCYTILYNSEYGDVIRNIAYNVSMGPFINYVTQKGGGGYQPV